MASADNAAAAGLLRTVRAELVRCEHNTMEYEIALARPPAQGRSLRIGALGVIPATGGAR